MEQLRSVCGLGTVTGLHGANCYHDYNPFIPGISVRTYTDEWLDAMNAQENEPKDYNGKQYTTYEALQQQRKMERTMRKTRQDINLMQNGEADSEQIMLKKAKYQGQMQTYKDFSKKMQLPEQMDRVYQDGLSIGTKTKNVAKHADSGIIKTRNLSERNMANGLRTSPYHILTDEEIELVKQDMKNLNIPEDIIRFNTGSQTGFLDLEKVINVRGDILPDMDSNNVRDILSQKAVLAHEYYGHYLSDPSPFRIGDWRDEFKASYRAAIDAPGLSDDERRMLMLDAYDRAKEAGIPVRYNKTARMIYGYDE